MSQDIHTKSSNLYETRHHFGDIFHRIVGRYPLGQLAKLSGIPKQTLVSWRQGRVRSPRSLHQILIVAAILRWDSTEINEILIAARYPKLSAEMMRDHLQHLKSTASTTTIDQKQLRNEIGLIETLIERLRLDTTKENYISASPNPRQIEYFDEKTNRSDEFRKPQTIFGRDIVLQRILHLLSETNQHPIIAIDGMGGIGKTTLAKECAEMARSAGLFNKVLWIQSSRETSNPAHGKSAQFNFVSVLDSIATQLSEPTICKLPLPEKREKIRYLLSQTRPLIIIDNLETSAQHQDEILDEIQQISTTSKVIATSRHRFKGDIFTIHLEGLVAKDSIQMILSEAVERGIDFLSDAKSDELFPIVTTTGGSPLAMKLVVGQLGHLPLNIVLEHLQNVRLQPKRAIQDEYSYLYKFIFFPSWELLSDDGKKLLLSMAHFVPGTGGDYQAIQTVSGLLDYDFAKIVDELWKLSFVEVGKPALLNQKRYYLHALTHHFILSDIWTKRSAT